MSEFSRLQNNIKRLEDLSYSSVFDLDPFLLPKDEIVKNLVISRTEISREELNIIIDDKEETLKKYQHQSEEYKEDLNRKIENYKEIYKEKFKEYYKEAEEIINEVKNTIYNIIKEVKDITKRVITSFMESINSIPGIAIMISAPPWNVPSAIVLAMGIIDLLLSIINQMKSVVLYLSPLKKINIICSNDNIEHISSFINPLIESILSIWEKITGYDKVVNKLLESIKNVLKNRDSVFKRATKRLKKLGYYDTKGPKERKDYWIDGVKVYAYNEDDAEEVYNILKVFKTNNSHVYDYVEKIDENKFDELIKEMNEEIIIPIDYEKNVYVYDVELPDGTRLYNLDELELEEVKQKYDVIYI